MKIGIIINKENEVTATAYTSTEEYTEPYICVEVSEDDYEDLTNYLSAYSYIDNKLILDKTKKAEIIKQHEKESAELNSQITQQERDRLAILTIKSNLNKKFTTEELEFIENISEKLVE